MVERLEADGALVGGMFVGAMRGVVVGEFGRDVVEGAARDGVGAGDAGGVGEVGRLQP